jgi:hypothetical protein
MAFRYAHIQPNLPPAIRFVERVRACLYVVARDFVWRGEQLWCGACEGLRASYPFWFRFAATHGSKCKTAASRMKDKKPMKRTVC